MCRPRRILPSSIQRWRDGSGEPIAIIETTTRVTAGTFLLRPDPRSRALILGVLGRAQSRYGFELYGYAFLSNHFSLLLGVRDPKILGDVMCFINGNLAKELAKRHGWQGRFWGRRHRAIPILDDESLAARMRYLLGNSTKEHLVKHAKFWPGAHCARALCSGRADVGVWVDRSALHRRRAAQGARKDGGAWIAERELETEYAVRLAPLPCWEDLAPEERQQRYQIICDELAEEARQERLETRRSVAGQTRVTRTPPHSRQELFIPSNAPFSHGANHLIKRDFRLDYNIHYATYLEAKEGLMGVVDRFSFPSGCYPPV